MKKSLFPILLVVLVLIGFGSIFIIDETEQAVVIQFGRPVGGAIQDAAENNADLTLFSPGATNSLSANKALKIDGLVPTIVSVTSTTPDGSYTIGDTIALIVITLNG